MKAWKAACPGCGAEWRLRGYRHTTFTCPELATERARAFAQAARRRPKPPLPLPEPPVRTCCLQRHAGVVCPDGLVMCCLCFNRVPMTQLARDAEGYRVDVCLDCAAAELGAATSL